MICILSGIEKYRQPLTRFFEGKLYPLIVAAITLLGHVTGLEYYLNILNMLAVSLALLTVSSFKAILPFMLTVIYQVNIKHTPGIPTWSTYYYETPRLVILMILVAILVACLVYFIVKNIIPAINKKDVPLLPAVIVLSAGFIMNGVFSSSWVAADLIFGIAQIFPYLIIFYLVYYGLGKEEPEELLNHLSYLALLIGGVLVGEMAFMFLTYDNIFENGSIVKEAVNLGWGIWNPIGFSLTSVIPLQMRGAMKGKYPWAYFSMALLCWIFAVLTLSRNALIFATLTFALCVVIACFVGNHRKAFRVICAVGVIAAAVIVVLLWSKISSVLSDLVGRGFSDNGRFGLWAQAWNNFLSSPLFGVGFFGFGQADATFEVVGFFPNMAHNSILELLSSCGIFGTGAYLVYRTQTLIPFFKGFSSDKLLLLITALVPLLMGLLDNYIFYYYPLFLSLISIATAMNINRQNCFLQQKNEVIQL